MQPDFSNQSPTLKASKVSDSSPEGPPDTDHNTEAVPTTVTADPLASQAYSNTETTVKNSSRVPLSSQITEMLIREIKSGVLVDGERLPPERSMAKRLGIAVGTLRKALAELEKLGLLVRIQGSGNYVHHPLDLDNIYALFRLELNTGPATPTARLLSFEKRLRPDGLPLVSPSPHVFRFTRLRRLDQVNAALEEVWLDGRYATDIDPACIDDSLYGFYQQHLSLWIIRAEDRVGVARLPSWAPAELKRSHIQYWGYVERLSRDRDSLVAEYSRTWYDPTCVRFVAR